MACIRKNTRCPDVTAATALVPNPVTTLMCMKPTVANSRLEMIVGQAKRQTPWLEADTGEASDDDKGGLRLLSFDCASGFYSAELLALFVAKTIGSVIVDHTRGLHEGIHDCRADEGEAALF